MKKLLVLLPTLMLLSVPSAWSQDTLCTQKYSACMTACAFNQYAHSCVFKCQEANTSCEGNALGTPSVTTFAPPRVIQPPIEADDGSLHMQQPKMPQSLKKYAPAKDSR